MKMRFLTFCMVLAFAGGMLADAAEPPADKDAATTGRNAPLCRVVPVGELTKAVPKQATDKTRADCKSLTEAINKCVHLENTVIWLGVWQQAQIAGKSVYTNRLDFMELQQRIEGLTRELNTHADRLQNLIRQQNMMGL